MAITIIQPLAWSTQDGGFDGVQLPYNEVNSATYKVGAVLVPNGTAGELIEATSGSPPITKIAGIAMQAGQNIASAPAYPNYGGSYPTGAAQSGPSAAGTASAVFPLLCAMALPGQVFEGTLANAGADQAIASSYIYTRAGLTKDATSGYWYVDVGLSTTNTNVLILGIKNVQDVVLGTTLGVRVYFMFLTPGTLIGAEA